MASPSASRASEKFLLILKRLKRCLLSLPPWKENSLQVNVLIKAFCRFISLHPKTKTSLNSFQKKVHKFSWKKPPSQTFFFIFLRWKISQIVFCNFFCFHRKERVGAMKSFAICKKVGIYGEICIEIQYLTIKISGGIKSNIVALEKDVGGKLILYVDDGRKKKKKLRASSLERQEKNTSRCIKFMLPFYYHRKQ